MEQFNDIYELAEYFNKKYHDIPYPDKPEKPMRGTHETNASWGIALDEYGKEMKQFRQNMKEYWLVCGTIEKEFRDNLLEYLGIKDHPKVDKLYSMAWEDGHSSGFSEVSMIAENLAELIK